MGINTSNAAFAYDMQAAPAPMSPLGTPRAPRAGERPRFDVYTGAAREANQAVSPAFTHVVKIFCILVALFCVIGVARVTIASATAATLNASAAATNELEAAQDTSSSLEVMRSVYGADTRVRDLATSTLGMVEPEETVTVDVSDPVAQDAQTQDAADGATDAAVQAQ